MKPFWTLLFLLCAFTVNAADDPEEDLAEAMEEEEVVEVDTTPPERRWVGLDFHYGITTLPNYYLNSVVVGTGGYKVALNFEVLLLEKIGKLGIGIGTGAYAKMEMDLGTDAVTLVTSTANIYAIPVELFLAYRFDYWPTQLLIPYVKAGGEFNLIASRIANSGDDTVVNATSTYMGVTAAGGMELNLSRLDPAAARSFRHNNGIKGTYFSGEYLISQGMGSLTADLTRAEIRLGLRMEI